MSTFFSDEEKILNHHAFQAYQKPDEKEEQTFNELYWKNLLATKREEILQDFCGMKKNIPYVKAIKFYAHINGLQPISKMPDVHDPHLFGPDPERELEMDLLSYFSDHYKPMQIIAEKTHDIFSKKIAELREQDPELKKKIAIKNEDHLKNKLAFLPFINRTLPEEDRANQPELRRLFDQKKIQNLEEITVHGPFFYKNIPATPEEKSYFLIYQLKSKENLKKSLSVYFDFWTKISYLNKITDPNIDHSVWQIKPYDGFYRYSQEENGVFLEQNLIGRYKRDYAAKPKEINFIPPIPYRDIVLWSLDDQPCLISSTTLEYYVKKGRLDFSECGLDEIDFTKIDWDGDWSALNFKNSVFPNGSLFAKYIRRYQNENTPFDHQTSITIRFDQLTALLNNPKNHELFSQETCKIIMIYRKEQVISFFRGIHPEMKNQLFHLFQKILENNKFDELMNLAQWKVKDWGWAVQNKQKNFANMILNKSRELAKQIEKAFKNELEQQSNPVKLVLHSLSSLDSLEEKKNLTSTTGSNQRSSFHPPI